VQAGLAALDAAVRDIRTDPEPYLLLADQARATGQTISALALYDKGIELTKSYDANAKRKRRFVIRAHSGRAAVLQQWEDWADAQADLQVILAEDPEDAGALSRLGVVLFMLDKPAEGYDAFVKAKELNKDLAPPYVAAAAMYQRLGKPDQARQAFERAYAADKTDKATLIAYGQWLLQTGQLDLAKTVLADARKTLPNSFEVFLLSGLAARMSGDFEQAEQLLVQSLAMSPTNRDIINQLALLLFDQDDQEKKQRGASYAQLNANLHNNNADVLTTLAWVMYKLGRANEFNDAYQRALRSGTMSPDAKYLIAKMMVDQKRTDVAKKLLDNAGEDYPGIFVMKNEAEALLQSLR
jgi:tetratricopeptide (TPR) repeat protein